MHFENNKKAHKLDLSHEILILFIIGLNKTIYKTSTILTNTNQINPFHRPTNASNRIVQGPRARRPPLTQIMT